LVNLFGQETQAATLVGRQIGLPCFRVDEEENHLLCPRQRQVDHPRTARLAAPRQLHPHFAKTASALNQVAFGWVAQQFKL